jgi:folate-binding protein YgfZ
VRIERGSPRWGVDIREKTLPPEMGASFVERTVSYQKGCYTGQEVLMRIKSRGHTNRTWTGLVCESPVDADSQVGSSVRESAGFVTSSAVSPDFGPIAAAMLHNEAAVEGTEVVVVSAGKEVKAVVRPFPLRA